jgi:hypothetical protein
MPSIAIFISDPTNARRAVAVNPLLRHSNVDGSPGCTRRLDPDARHPVNRQGG